MSKITLNPVGSIAQQPISAATTINNNFQAIQIAFDNSLSRDGSVPDQMLSNLDMNSNRIVNLPVAQNSSEPVTLGTFNSLTVSKGNVPSGGTTSQILAKNSSTSYDVSWHNQSDTVLSGQNIAVTGTSPVSIATVNNPSFTSINSGSLNLSGLTASSAVATDGSKNLVSVTNTGTGNNVLATSPSLVTPALGTPASGVLTNTTGLPVASGISGLGTGTSTALGINVGTAGSVVTNGGALGTPASGTATNITALNATQLTTGTVPAARTNGHQNGTATNDNAASGEIGEYIASTLVRASATSITTVTPKTVTSISLTAGDWDVRGVAGFFPANTTSVTQMVGSISSVNNTLDTTEGRLVSSVTPATVYDGSTGANLGVPSYRISLSSTTTIYLVAQSTFTISTNAAYGIISARRVR